MSSSSPSTTPRPASSGQLVSPRQRNNPAATLVRASAGTGKTYQLTGHLLRTLFGGAAPETIVATTFTRKAAGEITDRVLNDLALAADPADASALEKLRQQIGDSSVERESAANMLRRLLASIHQFRIGTLDSLFAQMARRLAFETDLPVGWRVVDEVAAQQRRRSAVHRTIERLDAAELTTLLAMLSKGNRKRSIARELDSVIAATDAASRGVPQDAWEQLRVPSGPTGDALDELAGRLREAAANTKAKRHITKLNQLAQLLETGQRESVAADGLHAKIAAARQSGDPVKYYSVFNPPIDDLLDALYALARTEKLGLLKAQNEATGRVLEVYRSCLRAISGNTGEIDFSDVADAIADCVNVDPETSLDKAFECPVDHLLLDEFQDTAPIQWHVLSPIASRVAPADQTKRTFFCVGDVKQAIYGWRGGVAEIFDSVAQQIGPLTEESLDRSFRSSPVIIETINRIFPKLGRHPAATLKDATLKDASSKDAGKKDASKKDLGTREAFEALALESFAKRFPTHETARTDLSGYFEFITSDHVEGDADAKRGACFDLAAEKVSLMHREHPTRSIGILTRRNASVADLIHRIAATGADVSQEGGNPLTDSPAVDLILSALLSAEFPGDKRWAFHLAQSPLSPAAGWTPRVIRERVAEQGLMQTVIAMGDALLPVGDPRDRTRMLKLVEMASAANRFDRIVDFVRVVQNQRVAHSRPAAIRVMTIHQSKGLEFDTVVLPEIDGELVQSSGGGLIAQADGPSATPRGLCRSLAKELWHFLPNDWQQAFGMDAAGKMTEAICLMYVAMTRSKRALHLIASPDKNMVKKKSVASLVYNALDCDADPTTPLATLDQSGDAAWT